MGFRASTGDADLAVAAHRVADAFHAPRLEAVVEGCARGAALAVVLARRGAGARPTSRKKESADGQTKKETTASSNEHEVHSSTLRAERHDRCAE